MWKMNVLLLDDEEYLSYLNVNIPKWKSEGGKELTDKRSVWVWIKYNIRMHAIRYSKGKAKQRNDKERMIQALSTLIHFQMKTELFCSVFKKICVHTRFRPSTLQYSISLKMLLYSQCAWSNELDECTFICIGPRNWCEIEATW